MSRSVIIALDNIRSHHNVGSVFRSADAFGIEKIILGGISPCPPHRDIQKTALGATESVDWEKEEDLLTRLDTLKLNGYKIIAVEQTEQSQVLPSMTDFVHEKIVLVFGNEVHGVSQNICDFSDEIWEIPQIGVKKSLNVSVCAGICMHHITLHSNH